MTQSLERHVSTYKALECEIVKTFLLRKRLFSYWGEFVRLGVKSMSDLAYIREEHLQNMGMSAVEQQAFQEITIDGPVSHSCDDVGEFEKQCSALRMGSRARVFPPGVVPPFSHASRHSKALEPLCAARELEANDVMWF